MAFRHGRGRGNGVGVARPGFLAFKHGELVSILFYGIAKENVVDAAFDTDSTRPKNRTQDTLASEMSLV